MSAKMASIDLLHKHTEEKLKALQQQSSSIYNFEVRYLIFTHRFAIRKCTIVLKQLWVKSD